MNCQDYQEIIAAHVDGALPAEESLAVQSHLDGCPGCKKMFLRETEFKKYLKRRLTLYPMRGQAKQRLLERLEESRDRGFFRWLTPSYGLTAVFAVLLLAVFPYLLWQNKAQENMFVDAVAHYRTATQGAANTLQDSLPPPAARLLDLSPWGYRVLARQAREFEGRIARVFVYQGRGNEYLLAQEFDGAELPLLFKLRPERLLDKGFATYSRDGVNVVAWKEKDILCILTSTMDQRELLGLAQNIAARS